MGNLSQISHYVESLGVQKGKSKCSQTVRYFNVRIGHSSSHKFMQDQGVPQGSVLSVTLFNIHMSNILHQLPTSVRGMFYVDDLQVSCQGSDMRLIERQLQTTFNRLVKWCDQNGHTISPSKSSCVHFCRKQYGSARATVLKRLDTVHHFALRICSGAFRTSPVSSLYVVCHQPLLELKRRQLSANYFIPALPVPSHPLNPSGGSPPLAVAINRALQLIDSNMPCKYCIYTDGMSVLEALENYNDRCHPVVCEILEITSRLYGKGFDIVFCWLPSHVGIIGKEQTDSAARSATTHLPLAVPLSGAWPVMPMRRTDVKLTRLRIGHTRLTHRHLLFGERAPECPSCDVSYTVHHILLDCPVFNTHRMTLFYKSVLTLSDLFWFISLGYLKQKEFYFSTYEMLRLVFESDPHVCRLRRPVPMESGVWGSCCVPFGPCFSVDGRQEISSLDSNTGSFGIPKTVALGLVLQLGVPWVNWRITSRTCFTILQYHL
ncbi:putative RNA-directed DNA polymerase from transposon BS [Trichonephila clavipes]|nr:putative RNA-directed DNA polymerase from transposon BS [Trichonephila clavipes]